MPSRVTLTPMVPLIGPHATSLPALSIASLGSKSVMIQIRTFDPVPTVGESTTYSGFLQPDQTTSPNPLIAKGVVLTLAYAQGPRGIKPWTQVHAPVVAPATTPTHIMTASSSFTCPRLRPLSQQQVMALIPPPPGLPPRKSLRHSHTQLASHCWHTFPKHPSISSPSGFAWICFLLCLVLVSTYFFPFNQMC